MSNDFRLNISDIIPHLNEQTHALIAELEIFPCIDSTNNYLMTRAQTDAPSGCVCFAEEQTAGKGRLGRQWISPWGHNVYGSFLWRFDSVAQLSGLSLAIGVGVIRVLNQHGISNVGLKWPNDIYSDGKKLGGILIEAMTHSNGSASAVIGLGLNLNLPVEVEGITQAFTDLQKVAPDVTLEHNHFIAQLLNELVPIAATFARQGLAAYLDEWRNYDCLLGKPATLFFGSQPIKGIVQGIDENGLLKLQCSDGTIQAFASGEVSFSA
ncbi:MAG: biotin--[acetyl-CoA-carboxylase] ligase [Methylococcaceae bacterium]